MERKFSRRQMIGTSLKLTSACLLAPIVANSSGDYNIRPVNSNTIEKIIPSSGEKIPAIGRGTCQTFDAGNSGAKRNQLEEVLNIFVSSGGKLIDSSPMDGSSEEVVGAL